MKLPLSISVILLSISICGASERNGNDTARYTLSSPIDLPNTTESRPETHSSTPVKSESAQEDNRYLNNLSKFNAFTSRVRSTPKARTRSPVSTSVPSQSKNVIATEEQPQSVSSTVPLCSPKLDRSAAQNIIEPGLDCALELDASVATLSLTATTSDEYENLMANDMLFHFEMTASPSPQEYRSTEDTSQKIFGESSPIAIPVPTTENAYGQHSTSEGIEKASNLDEYNVTKTTSEEFKTFPSNPISIPARQSAQSRRTIEESSSLTQSISGESRSDQRNLLIDPERFMEEQRRLYSGRNRTKSQQHKSNSLSNGK